MNWESLAQFHFLRPWWLLLLLCLPLLLVWWWKFRLRSGSWSAVIDPQLLPHLLTRTAGRRGIRSLLLLALAGLLAIVALAGPSWQQLPQPLFRQQSSLVVLLDLSRSMLSNDLQPNRLQRALYKLTDLLKQRNEGQTALVVFAGSAFTVTPLTEDRLTIEAMLSSLNPDLMPSAGSRVDLAIEKALELFTQAGVLQGQVLLIGDGSTPAAIQVAARLKRAGHRLLVLGVGTPQGAPIPLPTGGFLKDQSGNIVMPKLEEAPLQQLATAGGGRYQRLRFDDRDLQQLQAGWQSGDLQQDEQSQARFDLWREEGPWLLLPLLPLVALLFRRGYLLLLVALIPLPRPVSALEWSDLWLNQQQQAKQAFDRQEYGSAAEQFSDPRWKGAALYNGAHYEASLEALKGLEDSDSRYNRANALARLGKLEEAVAEYRQALEQRPDFSDAEYNLKQVEEALKQRQQQQQNSQNQSQDSQPSEQSQDQHQNQQQGQSSDQGGESQESQGEESSQNQPSEQGRNAESDPQQAGGSRLTEDEMQAEPSSQPQQSGQQSQAQPQEPGIQAEPAEAESAASESSKAGAEAEPVEAEPAEAGAESVEAKPANTEAAEDQAQREQRLANEQWLRRIPDDPAGLLRRKFLYQYRQNRPTDNDEVQQPW